MTSRSKLPYTLPPDIITDILTRNLTQPPACALALLCPEWFLCHRRRRHPYLQTVLRTTRIDTYTLAADPDRDPDQPQRGGTVSTSFGHAPGGGACLCLPYMNDPRPMMEEKKDGGGGGGLPGYYRREVVRRWAGKSVVVVSQRDAPALVGPLWAGDWTPEAVGRMVILREEGAVRLLPYEDDLRECFDAGGGGGEEEVAVYSVDGREKDALPKIGSGYGGDDGGPRYLFQRLRHLVVNSVPALADVEATELGMLPSTWGPGVTRNLACLAERLEYERRAHLLLRWNALERLETLCLDLRGYSLSEDRYLHDEDVVSLARSLSGKSLRLLVIAGLRSWGRYPGPFALGIAEVESAVWDSVRRVWMSEKRGEGISWWHMFREAVRPGGQLVFVDKQNEEELRLLRPAPRHKALLDY